MRARLVTQAAIFVYLNNRIQTSFKLGLYTPQDSKNNYSDFSSDISLVNMSAQPTPHTLSSKEKEKEKEKATALKDAKDIKRAAEKAKKDAKEAAAAKAAAKAKKSPVAPLPAPPTAAPAAAHTMSPTSSSGSLGQHLPNRPTPPGGAPTPTPLPPISMQEEGEARGHYPYATGDQYPYMQAMPNRGFHSPPYYPQAPPQGFFMPQQPLMFPPQWGAHPYGQHTFVPSPMPSWSQGDDQEGHSDIMESASEVGGPTPVTPANRPRVATDDNTEETSPDGTLQYTFQEAVNHTVDTKVADLMTRALAETSPENFRTLINTCKEMEVPSNVPAKVPELDFRVKQLVSAPVKLADDHLVDVHKSILAMAGPQARILEATLHTSKLTREELLLRLKTVRKFSSGGLQAMCATTGQLTRHRRKLIKQHTTGFETRMVDWQNSPVATDKLFGDDTLQQCTLPRRGGKLLFTNVYKQKGLCEGAINTMASARKEQSNTLYAPYIEKYALWAYAQGVNDPFSCDIAIPINFMQFMKDEAFDPKNPLAKRGYSNMRVVVSALSTVLSYDSNSFGSHHMMKGG